MRAVSVRAVGMGTASRREFCRVGLQRSHSVTPVFMRMSSARRTTLALVLLGTAACKGDPVVPPPAACEPDAAGSVALQMPVGSVQVLSGNEAVGCVRLQGDLVASNYIAIAANATTASDVDAAYRFVATRGSGAAVTASLGLAGVRAAITSDAPSAALPVHDRLRLKERALRQLHPDAPLASAPAARTGAVRGAIFTGTPSVGQVVTINAPGLGADDSPCDDFTALRGRVMYISQKAIIVQDTTSPANGFTTTDFQSIGAEFDDLIWRTDTTYFGNPSDSDVNTRIVVFYTPYVNKATPRNSGSILAGFFWAGDLFPRGECAQSNQGELFYLLVPDPTGIFSGARQVSDVRERTRGTVAHEFEHMINAGVRIRTGASALEEVWLDEALAHFAEEMVGRAKLGASDTEELTHARVFDSANNLRDYNAFFYQNLARFDYWLDAPGKSSPTSEAADSSLAVRGAAWALLRHSADHYGGGNIPLFTRRLVTGPQTGVNNLQARTNVPFDQIMSRWLVANYADNLGIPNLAATYTYPSWNMRDAVSGAVRTSYPLQLTTVAASGTQSGTVRSGSGWYYQVPLAAGAPRMALSLQNNFGRSGFPGARLILLRQQ